MAHPVAADPREPLDGGATGRRGRAPVRWAAPGRRADPGRGAPADSRAASRRVRRVDRCNRSASGWITFVLEQFPYTRPWGEDLEGNLLALLKRVAIAIAESLPGLLLVVVIFLIIACAVIRTLGAFLTGSKRAARALRGSTPRPRGRRGESSSSSCGYSP